MEDTNPENTTGAHTVENITEDDKPENTVEENKENIKPDEGVVASADASRSIRDQPRRIKISEVGKEKTQCPDCLKPVNKKNLKYTHPKTCEGKPCDTTKTPIRPKAKAKFKITVKPLETVEVPQHQPEYIQPPPTPKAKTPTMPNQQVPLNPYAGLTQSQLLQLQYRSMSAEIARRRQEKANNLSKAMFQSRSKKSK